MPRAKPKDDRGRDIQRIHILKSQLKLDDDAYRDVLWVHGRVRSSTELDRHGRAEVLKHLQGQLARVAPQQARRVYPGRPHNVQAKDRRELRKIEALLTDAGRGWDYAETTLEQMTRGRKRKLAFASPGELAGIITALELEARKRLQPELAQQCAAEGLPLGYAVVAARLMFGLGPRSDISKSAQCMSLVLRWMRGQLVPAPSCRWPE